MADGGRSRVEQEWQHRRREKTTQDGGDDATGGGDDSSRGREVGVGFGVFDLMVVIIFA